MNRFAEPHLCLQDKPRACEASPVTDQSKHWRGSHVVYTARDCNLADQSRYETVTSIS